MITTEPLAKMLRYYHAALWANGAWTVAPREKTGETLAQLFANLPASDED
jgi:hypothetical protein